MDKINEMLKTHFPDTTRIIKSFRLSPEVYKWLVTEAKKKNRSISNMLETILKNQM